MDIAFHRQVKTSWRAAHSRCRSLLAELGAIRPRPDRPGWVAKLSISPAGIHWGRACVAARSVDTLARYGINLRLNRHQPK